MNDRIKHLIMEAVNFRLDPDSDAYEAQICPEDLEYLAELIVRECAKVADDGFASSNFGNGITGHQLLKHFGVDISS